MSDPAEQYAAAIAALNRADWASAQNLASRLMAIAPRHGGVYFVAGVAALRLHQVEMSIAYLQRAVALNASRPDYWAELARAFTTARLMREALHAADKAFALSPQDALVLDTLGVVYGQANAHERAAAVFRHAASLMPGTASYRFHVATSLTFSGDILGAETAYEECLRLDPGFWKAHLALSQLRTQTADANHLARLTSLLAAHGSDREAAMYLNLALAKEHEDLKEYEASFVHLSEGKRKGGSTRGYSIARDEDLFGILMRSFPESTSWTGGFPTREPIFVIGMPRSGTTLVERILSSHPQVHSAGELQNFSVALKRASGSPTRLLFDVDTIKRSLDLDWNRLGADYLESTRPATAATPHFVDKLPHNFLYAGFIARALPQAKIICLRRGPMDTCLSNFRQLFAQTSPYYDYSFDLLDIGRYYVMFDRLMAHWERVMPGRILEIEYESIVDDQVASTRRLLEHCGLEWNDACVSFEKNDAPVATASAVQVRKPIYRTAIRRWKRYEQELAGLRKLLEDSGIAAD